MFEVPEFVPTAIELEPETASVKSSHEILNIEEANEIIPHSMIQPTMNIPKYRHSIDLAMTCSANSPKYKTFHITHLFAHFLILFIRFIDLRNMAHSGQSLMKFRLDIQIV